MCLRPTVLGVPSNVGVGLVSLKSRFKTMQRAHEGFLAEGMIFDQLYLLALLTFNIAQSAGRE